MRPLKLDPSSAEAVEEPETGAEFPGPTSSTGVMSGPGSMSECVDPGPEPPGLSPTSNKGVTSGPGSTSECVDVSPPAGSCDEPETPSPVLRKGEELVPVLRKGEELVGPEEEPEPGESDYACR